MTLEPGEIWPAVLGWDQTYYLYDPPLGPERPPSGGPVPEGAYWIYVDFAPARFVIDWSCATGAPTADAGPDLELPEGSPARIGGSGAPPLQLGDWQRKANLTAPRYGFAHAVLDGRVYVAGGHGFTYPPPSTAAPTDTQVYDPATDRWTVAGSGPGCGGKPGIAGASLGGQFYAFGAYQGPCDVRVNSTEVFDAGEGRWHPRADMPTSRADLAVAVVNGRAYALGGRLVGGNVSAANEAYDFETDSWQIRAPMPTARSHLAAVSWGGHVYAIGGSAGNVVERYDPATDTWTTLRDLPGHRLSYPAAAVESGVIFLVDSRVSFDTTCCSVALLYEPGRGRLISLPSLILPRFGAGLEVVGDVLIAVGGGYVARAGSEIAPAATAEALSLTPSDVSFAWDANSLADSDGDGNLTNDVDAADSTLTWTYGDDGAYTATLTVTNAAGKSARDTSRVTVTNTPPRVVELEVTAEGGVTDLGLRVAGRKWNVANVTLIGDGGTAGAAEVRRGPGSPDEQTAWVPIPIVGLLPYRAVVGYEPAELDGEEVGANPVWLVGRDPSGNVSVLARHTFNVEQSENRNGSRWNHIDPWEVDLSGRLGRVRVAIRVVAEDNGSDDLVFVWPGVPNRTYYNDGSGPDPPTSPAGAYPFRAEDRWEPADGHGILILLTIRDDDGGSVTIEIPL